MRQIVPLAFGRLRPYERSASSAVSVSCVYENTKPRQVAQRPRVHESFATGRYWIVTLTIGRSMRRKLRVCAYVT